MHIALVGMSGTGKSHWSHLLAQAGFARIGCDDGIAARLAAEVGAPTGEYFNMGQWMGFPYEEHYPQRAARYLYHEQALMAEIVAQMDAAPPQADVVIDTTGSVIYVPDATLSGLRRVTRIIYLAPPLDAFDAMLHAYLANPRPVLWNGHFRPADGESPEQTFARCYPHLLASRDQLYRQISHTVIPYAVHAAPDLPAAVLLDLIAEAV